VSLFRSIRDLIKIDWNTVLGQYSPGALIVELLILPFWFYLTGLSYVNVKALLGCNSLICYKISLLFSIIPSSIISGVLSSISRTYLFKDGYNITTVPVKTVSKKAWVNQRVLVVGLFALSVSSVAVYTVCKVRPNSSFAYRVKTFKPRVKHKLNYVKMKLQRRKQSLTSRFTKLRKKLRRNKRR
jgi:hypothetical protein